jgi:hypothetical protein
MPIADKSNPQNKLGTKTCEAQCRGSEQCEVVVFMFFPNNLALSAFSFKRLVQIDFQNSNER